MTTRALIYARLSQDRNGESTSTTRQVADCESWAAARGWEVVGRYVDADLSAFRDVARPEYERMLGAVADGETDVILSWKLDRLLRRPRELERLLHLCETSGARIATLQDGIDTSTNFGEVMPRMLSIFAEMESKNISIRQRSKAAEIAKAGRHHGGGTRPFGLSADWRRTRPKEAAIIHEAAARILAGEPLRSVAMDLNRRSIPTSTGGQWRAETLRQTLVSPRVAGLRTHHGVVVGSGGYPAILDEDTYRRLEATVRHRNGSRGPQGRKYLLSGFLRCHACNRPMYGHRNADGRLTYICAPQPRGCGRTKIGAEPVDELVRDRVLDYLDTPALAAALEAHERKSAGTIDLDALRRDESALEELARDYYADHIIGKAEYLAARDTLQRRIEAAQRKLSRSNGSGTLHGLAGTGVALREVWEHEPLDWRRTIIGAVLESITIGPARRGYNRFDPTRVGEPVWRY
jgi:site-specific DNA recombinase